MIQDRVDLPEKMIEQAAAWYPAHPIPEAFVRLPPILLRHIEQACEGDWRRASLNEDGSVDIDNRRTW